MDYTPIKTEYQGIVFDSKSEAVFARTLDLVRIKHPKTMVWWEYHPKGWEIESSQHEWDFKVLFNDFPHFNPYNSISLFIEYKPSSPTETYAINLTNKVNKKYPFHSAIVWGSPWNGPVWNDCSYVIYPIFLRGQKFGWGDFCQAADNGENFLCSYRHDIREYLGITEKIAQEAKQYRFDLR